MSINLANVPFSAQWGPFEGDPAGDDEWLMFRMPAEGRILAAYSLVSSGIATATNTVALYLTSKGTTGTDASTTVASFAAASGWTADVPRTGSLTAANQDVASGTWLAVKYDESGTGRTTDLTVHVDYMLATGATT